MKLKIQNIGLVLLKYQAFLGALDQGHLEKNIGLLTKNIGLLTLCFSQTDLGRTQNLSLCLLIHKNIESLFKIDVN